MFSISFISAPGAYDDAFHLRRACIGPAPREAVARATGGTETEPTGSLAMLRPLR